MKQVLFAAAAIALCQAYPADARAPILHQVAASESARQGDFVGAAAAANALIRAHHYSPTELEGAAYNDIEAKVLELGQTVRSQDQFVSKFNALWQTGPFSHVNLAVARANAEETAAYLDQMRVGGRGVRLEWNENVAVLTVQTMMGADTIEQIDAAYAEIQARGARALIIDLRKNEGGAFAVRPLIEHLITKPFDAGAFVSRRWADRKRGAPTRQDVAALTPWTGWSLRAFWRDVETTPITRIRFSPVAPNYAGPVYVLAGRGTASAAELAADALASSGRAIVIGEKTRGKMLSQKPFDLPSGLQLFLPIADYHAFRSGRIEGSGVAPDIAVAADQAMDVALNKIRSAP